MPNKFSPGCGCCSDPTSCALFYTVDLSDPPITATDYEVTAGVVFGGGLMSAGSEIRCFGQFSPSMDGVVFECVFNTDSEFTFTVGDLELTVDATNGTITTETIGGASLGDSVLPTYAESFGTNTCRVVIFANPSRTECHVRSGTFTLGDPRQNSNWAILTNGPALSARTDGEILIGTSNGGTLTSVTVKPFHRAYNGATLSLSCGSLPSVPHCTWRSYDKMYPSGAPAVPDNVTWNHRMSEIDLASVVTHVTDDESAHSGNFDPCDYSRTTTPGTGFNGSGAAGATVSFEAANGYEAESASNPYPELVRTITTSTTFQNSVLPADPPVETYVDTESSVESYDSTGKTPVTPAVSIDLGHLHPPPTTTSPSQAQWRHEVAEIDVDFE